MTPKLPSILIAPPDSAWRPPAESASELAARWNEARLAYPLYAALAAQFEVASALYPAGEQPSARPSREILDRDLKWFDAIDEKIRAFQIRQFPS